MIATASSQNGQTGKKFNERRIELARLFDKLPPNALEAESALLGSMILDWRVCGDVLQICKGSSEFYDPAHASIYQALIDLYDKNQSIDMVQLKQRLDDLGQLDNVGGVDALIELAESVPSAASANHYAKIVHEKAILRKLIESAGRILYDCYNSSEPASDMLDKAERDIFEV